MHACARTLTQTRVLCVFTIHVGGTQGASEAGAVLSLLGVLDGLQAAHMQHHTGQGAEASLQRVRLLQVGLGTG